MCHTAVAQLDTSYPAVDPIMAVAQSPAAQAKPNRYTRGSGCLQPPGSLQHVRPETKQKKSLLFAPFPGRA